MTASEKPLPKFLPDDIKLTVTEEPAASFSPFAASSVLKDVGMKQYSSLVEDAVSVSPTAGVSMNYLDNMFSPAKKQPMSCLKRNREWNC